jgi:hypothetical protein
VKPAAKHGDQVIAAFEQLPANVDRVRPAEACAKGRTPCEVVVRVALLGVAQGDVVNQAGSLAGHAVDEAVEPRGRAEPAGSVTMARAAARRCR